MANTLKTLLIILSSTVLMSFDISNDSVLVCENKLELINAENESFIFKVTTQDSFESTLYVLEENSYEKVSSLNGSNTQEVTFANIQSEKIYKLITKFSTNSPLCATRQLTGLIL